MARILFWLTILKKAFRAYYFELKYFCRAKRDISRRSKELDRRLLLIRKRAHHLERALFMPRAYSDKFAQDVAQELEEYLNGIDEGISPGIIKWAKKILAEFKNRTCGETFCPMLNKEAKRNLPIIKADDLIDLIKQRRSRRIFINIPLTQDQKNKITEVAQYAPSSCNRQTLDLIFVEEPRLKRFIASTVPGGHQFFDNAPCIIVIISDAADYKYPEDRTVAFADAAAAIQNIYLLCETLGLGCCWGSYSSYGSVRQEGEVRKQLKIPSAHLIVGALAIGKSNQFVCEIPRDLPQNRSGNDFFRSH